MNEQLIEQGIVLSSENGTAEIAISEKGECSECSAKIFCKPGKDNSRVIKASDPFNSKPGSKVNIVIEGKNLLLISIKLYGIPLLIFLSIIILSMTVFESSQSKELLSFIFSIAGISIYYFFVYLFSLRKKTLILPRIIS